MKILTIIGARPQFIKAAAVSRAIKSDGRIKERIIHTGQHFDSNMSDIFFEQMSIPVPDHRLEISGLTHGAMTGRMLEGIESILLDEKPDAVMVYGDTNTTLAGALAASKIHIPVVHVESGLRSFNMKMPEEINRILTDRISKLLLCPTEIAVKNLYNEGYEQFPVDIKNTGDVMYDAALFYSENSQQASVISENKIEDGFVLVTIHRAENTDVPEKLHSVMESLVEISTKQPVIFPVHPRTRQFMERYEGNTNLHMIDPVGYLEMIWLLQHSGIVVTDSGGLQKEAFFFKKPCITLREETEWRELVDVGANVIAGTEKQKILQSFHAMKSKDISGIEPLYGNGNASELVVNAIASL